MLLAYVFFTSEGMERQWKWVWSALNLVCWKFCCSPPPSLAGRWRAAEWRWKSELLLRLFSVVTHQRKTYNLHFTIWCVGHFALLWNWVVESRGMGQDTLYLPVMCVWSLCNLPPDQRKAEKKWKMFTWTEAQPKLCSSRPTESL